MTQKLLITNYILLFNGVSLLITVVIMLMYFLVISQTWKVGPSGDVFMQVGAVKGLFCT